MELNPASALCKQDIESLRREVREYGQIINASNGSIKNIQTTVEAGSCAICSIIIILFVGSWMISHVKIV